MQLRPLPRRGRRRQVPAPASRWWPSSRSGCARCAAGPCRPSTVRACPSPPCTSRRAWAHPHRPPPGRCATTRWRPPPAPTPAQSAGTLRSCGFHPRLTGQLFGLFDCPDLHVLLEAADGFELPRLESGPQKRVRRVLLGAELLKNPVPRVIRVLVRLAAIRLERADLLCAHTLDPNVHAPLAVATAPHGDGLAHGARPAVRVGRLQHRRAALRVLPYHLSSRAQRRHDHALLQTHRQRIERALEGIKAMQANGHAISHPIPPQCTSDAAARLPRPGSSRRPPPAGGCRTSPASPPRCRAGSGSSPGA